MAVKYEDLINKGGTIYNKAGRGYAKPEELATDLGIQPHQIDWTKITKQAPPVTPQDATGASQSATPTQTTDKNIQGVQKVFGQEWKPAEAFTPELQQKGIVGAVRVSGANDVYTLGTGGGLETPESFKQKFGTLEQQGIVGEVSPEQAKALGITAQNIPAPKVDQAVSSEDLAIPEKTINLPEPTSVQTTDNYIVSLTQDLENKRKQVEDVYNKQIADLEAKKEASQKKIDEFTAKQEGVITEDIKPLMQPFRAEMEKAERERLKVEENYFASQALTNELDTLLTDGNAIIQSQKEVTGLSSIREPRINQTISDITARAGVIQAVLAARNNQISVAYSLIDRSVAATTADRNDQLNYYNTLLNFYTSEKDLEGNKLVSLNAEQRQYINSQIGLLESDLAQSQATAEYLKQQFLDPDKAAIFGAAGVSLNDSIAEIGNKLSDYSYTQEVANTSNQLKEAGYEFVSPEQLATADPARLVSFTDSRGNTKSWLKPLPSDTEAVMNLMINYPQAGILKTDTLEQATAKIRPIIEQQTAIQAELDKLKLQSAQLGLKEQQASIYATQALAQQRLTPIDTSELLSVNEAATLGVPFGTTQEQAMGISPLGAQAKTTINALNSAQTIVSQIETSLKDIGLAATPLERLTTGVGNWLGSIAQTNTNIALYDSLKNGLVSTLSRAVGEKGVLTDQDIERAKNLLPNVTDTQAVAAGKMNQLKGLFKAFQDRATTSYTTPIITGSSNIQNAADTSLIQVKEKSSGQTGTIPKNEFDPDLYEIIK